jgi:hypothetical protein
VEWLGRAQGQVEGALGGVGRGTKALGCRRHVQGRGGGELGHEHGGVQQRLVCHELRRQVRVRNVVCLRLVEESARGRQPDDASQLCVGNPGQISQVLHRNAFLERDACEDLELGEPMEADENLDLRESRIDEKNH